MSLFMFMKCNGILTKSLTILLKESKPLVVVIRKAAVGVTALWNFTWGFVEQYFVLLLLKLESW